MSHQYFDPLPRPAARRQQEFSPLVDEYFLDRNDRLQLKPVQRDQQALIDSCEYTKLSEIYDLMTDIPRDSFLAAMQDTDRIVEERENYLSQLDILQEVDTMLDNYRQEAGINEVLSRSQLYDLIRQRAAEAEQTIINKRKELFTNETKQDPTSVESEQT